MTFEFTCRECDTTMTCTFLKDFRPDEHPDFPFCCLGCRRQYRITSWSPIWIVRNLDAGATAAAWRHGLKTGEKANKC